MTFIVLNNLFTSNFHTGTLCLQTIAKWQGKHEHCDKGCLLGRMCSLRKLLTAPDFCLFGYLQKLLTSLRRIVVKVPDLVGGGYL